MSMTRRDFQIIADGLRPTMLHMEHGEQSRGFLLAVYHLCAALKRCNPSFDECKFMQRLGYAGDTTARGALARHDEWSPMISDPAERARANRCDPNDVD